MLPSKHELDGTSRDTSSRSNWKSTQDLDNEHPRYVTELSENAVRPLNMNELPVNAGILKHMTELQGNSSQTPIQHATELPAHFG